MRNEKQLGGLSINIGSLQKLSTLGLPLDSRSPDRQPGVSANAHRLPAAVE
jgi:hypothetical protein